MVLDQILIFCDGASSGNPGPGGWGAIRVFPDQNGRAAKVQELGGKASRVTNNQMELRAALESLRNLDVSPAVKSIVIYTDSTYVIRGITQWIWGWQKKGWKTAEGKEVSNAELWKKLSFAVKKIKDDFGLSLTWKYIRGHTGVPGNERVDEIATSFSKGKPSPLFLGSLLKYTVSIFDLPEKDEPLPELKKRSEDKKVAYSYLSLVNGKLERHQTWKECEARIKGRPHAKFKKAMDAEQEARILAEWGYESI